MKRKHRAKKVVKPTPDPPTRTSNRRGGRGIRAAQRRIIEDDSTGDDDDDDDEDDSDDDDTDENELAREHVDGDYCGDPPSPIDSDNEDEETKELPKKVQHQFMSNHEQVKDGISSEISSDTERDLKCFSDTAIVDGLAHEEKCEQPKEEKQHI